MAENESKFQDEKNSLGKMIEELELSKSSEVARLNDSFLKIADEKAELEKELQEVLHQKTKLDELLVKNLEKVEISFKEKLCFEEQIQNVETENKTLQSKLQEKNSENQKLVEENETSNSTIENLNVRIAEKEESFQVVQKKVHPSFINFSQIHLCPFVYYGFNLEFFVFSN